MLLSIHIKWSKNSYKNITIKLARRRENVMRKRENKREIHSVQKKAKAKGKISFHMKQKKSKQIIQNNMSDKSDCKTNCYNCKWSFL